MHFYTYETIIFACNVIFFLSNYCNDTIFIICYHQNDHLNTILPVNVRTFLHIIRSHQISHSVVSDSLRPHESQHTRPPGHHQLPEFTQTHVHRVSDAIQPSHPLLSPSPPAPNPSQHQSLFQ